MALSVGVEGVAREVTPGEILLFRIHETPEILRPLLVVSVVDGDTVAGEVFLDYERDRGYDWPRKLFYQVGKDSRTQWVSGVLPGRGVGQWRERDGDPVGGERKAKGAKGRIRPLSGVELLRSRQERAQ